MDEILIAALVIGIIPLYPGWLMCQKAFFTSRWRILTVLICIVLPLLIAAPFFFLPFWLAKGQERDWTTMATDFVLWGICPVGLIGLVAYVMDHLEERPLRAALAGASCVAITLMAVAYYFYAPELQTKLGIIVSRQP